MSTRVVRRKPRTPSLRAQSYVYNDAISKGDRPIKSLLGGKIKKTGGRNCYGRITVRHRGGGAFQKYRIIDFNRFEKNLFGKVVSIQYDPNRNVPIALVVYSNGIKKYLLLAEGISVGSTVIASETADVSVGNALPLKCIPDGFAIHNIEVRPGSGGKMVRSAGASAQIVAKEGEYVTIKMPSGEIRLLHQNCWATVGALANAGYKNESIGKAGRNRWRGKRPSVRGMAMNPIDHPHGGGEGRSKSGSHPVSPWGKCAKGTKTRMRKSRFIIRRRNSV